ncbi:MAG TPA: inosine/xanthosine triphosphatase [Anaerolineaceae bacterium]|nr:inosine/xanthosine triphosphatase [Anaerolineaceae bacterium]
MKTIIIASNNPVKIQAALQGFQRMFPAEEFTIRQLSVPSGVNSQPFTDQETYLGACNRVDAAFQMDPQADFWVGIEGGVEEQDGELSAFAWIVVRSKNRRSRSRSGTFLLPKKLVDLIRQGIELGEADDIVFNRSNSKQANGAIGILTGDVIDRTELYLHAVILALVPFKNDDLY